MRAAGFEAGLPRRRANPNKYALLEFLLRNPGHPVTRAAIIEEVWRIHGDSITNVVDVYRNYLRRKIDSGADRPLIGTIRGVGYQIGGNHRAGRSPFSFPTQSIDSGQVTVF